MFSTFERLADPFPEDDAGPPPRGVWRFAWHYLRGVKWPLAAMSVLGGTIALLDVMLFALMGALIDAMSDAPSREAGFPPEAVSLLWQGAGVVAALLAITTVWSMVTHQAVMGNAPMMARWRMHRRLLGQTTGFFADEMAGRVSAKMMQSALAVRELLTKLLDLFVYVAVYFGTMTVLIGEADLRLLAPIAVWVVCYAVIGWLLLPRLARASEAQADSRSEMTGRIVDSYSNITSVKLFSHSGREEAYARNSMSDFLQTVHRQMRLVTWLEIALTAINNLVVAAVAGLGVWLWQRGDVSVGEVAAATALLLRFKGMSQWIMWETAALFENLGTAYDGMLMMTVSVAVTDAPDAPALEVSRGAIAFEAVSFHYGGETPVIEGLDLAVRPGEKVGIVGPSGAGKSTLVKLLLRFHDPETGRITVDGQDISTVSQDSLRAAIGTVTQDTSLLNRSIAENIAFGRDEASREAIEAAARRAGAHGFITGLADAKGRTGYDVQVGERGVKLSGGQRQRIAIARVFLKDAPLLVLDEATSALDSEAEAAIQQNLFALMEGKTVLAIAHRLSTIAEMDRIIVMEAGRISEDGDHAALLRRGGLYASLWSRQSGGFIGSADSDIGAERVGAAE